MSRRRRLDFAAATTLQALATPSRLLILGHLREEPATVGDLTDAVAVERSAVSDKLRLLRHLGLVHDERRGRSVVLPYDSHVAEQLEQAANYAEQPQHVRPGPGGQSRLTCTRWRAGTAGRIAGDSGRAAGANGRSRVRKRNLQPSSAIRHYGGHTA